MHRDLGIGANSLRETDDTMRANPTLDAAAVTMC
jgi:hypothetical protein